MQRRPGEPVPRCRRLELQGNACDIPTDCPTRERAGWTADWQLFVPAAAFLYDVAGFSAKWLRDLVAGQWDNGVVSNMAPLPRSEGRHGPVGGWHGSAGWGDAAVIVPWELYRAYGDTRILDEHWASMSAWLGYVMSTPYLLSVLADHGHADVAYELLLRDTPPSWLTMIDRGATTVWESWEGIDAHGRPYDSLNHYSKGAVIDFLHRYTAGIRLTDSPAYRSFVVEPVPGGGLTSASAAHESPYGRIESSWDITDGRMTIAVRVPPGTCAAVVADGTETTVGPGSYEFTVPQPDHRTG